MAETRGLNIVLFGNPSAGKSSLLGALWQVGQTQEPVLGGKINEGAPGLAELSKRLYDNQPRETTEEVVAYPITLEPTGDAKGSPIEATLIDCDGRVAQQYLTQNLSLAGSRDALAKAILKADALLLLVDPSAGGPQLEKDFASFCAFVQTLENLRAQRNEVTGLPIYLVLTKCDLLSKPTDPGSAWVQRIEEGKRKIDKRFQDFLAKIPGRDAYLFGKVDVHLWATAVKRPQLADKPARPTDPYGVAELFRQAFRSAREFHEHREQSQGRLTMAVFGVLGVIAFMAAAAGLFFLTRPSLDMTRLETKVREVLPPHKTTAAERLREPIDKRLKALEDILASPHFAELPTPVQDDVKQAKEEFEAYIALNKKLLDVMPDLKSAKNEKELDKAKEVVNQWTLAPEYKERIDAWKGSNLAEKHVQVERDIDAIRKTAKSEEELMRSQIVEADKLRKQGFALLGGTPTEAEKYAWQKNVAELRTRAARKSITDRIATDSTITYKTVYGFTKVKAAEDDLFSAMKKLSNTANDVGGKPG